MRKHLLLLYAMLFIEAAAVSLFAQDKIQHECIDLGLSVKWATCNVGASKPEEAGCHYAWGELEEKDNYIVENYKFYESDDYHHINKYNSISFDGFIDDKMILDPEDDVAHVKWGGKWRMPTKAELEELCDSCTWNWTTLNGVNGYMVTGKKLGYEDHSIFLPAAGCIWYDRNGYEGKCAYYSSSSLSTEEQEANWCLWFIDPDAQRFWKMAVSPDRLKRAVGQSVRPVCP